MKSACRCENGGAILCTRSVTLVDWWMQASSTRGIRYFIKIANLEEHFNLT